MCQVTSTIYSIVIILVDFTKSLVTAVLCSIREDYVVTNLLDVMSKPIISVYSSTADDVPI